MDWKGKIKDIDLQNLAGTCIAAFGSVTVTGFVQIIYCCLTCISFYLTYKVTVSKNKERLKEMQHQNRLLEIEIELKEKSLRDEKDK